MPEPDKLLPSERGATNRESLIVSSLPFVEAIARRMAASMPHSIDVGNMVQDGVIGLIDAAQRFDEGRGIKFETFAERRIRGAMIDALRKDAWPRGIRKQRRDLENARAVLRNELGEEPSLQELAARLRMNENKLTRRILRIQAIEATSPLAHGDDQKTNILPDFLHPWEPVVPDEAYEQEEAGAQIRAAIATLPQRDRKVLIHYYYREQTMRQIATIVGVNEARVSQLHARAIMRLRKALEIPKQLPRSISIVLQPAPVLPGPTPATTEVVSVKRINGEVPAFLTAEFVRPDSLTTIIKPTNKRARTRRPRRQKLVPLRLPRQQFFQYALKGIQLEIARLEEFRTRITKARIRKLMRDMALAGIELELTRLGNLMAEVSKRLK